MKPILFNTEMVKAILDGRKTATRRSPFQFEMKPGYNPSWSGYSLGEYCTGHIESGVCLYSRGAHDVWGVRSNVVKPRYQAGDILYVRETWQQGYTLDGNDQIIEDTGRYFYAAGPDEFLPHFSFWLDPDTGEHKEYMPWRPSIHMPKEAARIFLRVKAVRAERLQDINGQGRHDDILKEGIRGYTKDGELYKFCTDIDSWIDFHRKHERRFKFKGSFWQDMPRTPVEAFKFLWNSTIKEGDYGSFWESNPWVWVIEFDRISKEEALQG